VYVSAVSGEREERPFVGEVLGQLVMFLAREGARAFSSTAVVFLGRRETAFVGVGDGHWCFVYVCPGGFVRGHLPMSYRPGGRIAGREGRGPFSDGR
jgi:hypothetical protein